MRQQSTLLCSESSHSGEDDCDFIVYIILCIVYVEYSVMNICICIKLKRNYVGFDP